MPDFAQTGLICTLQRLNDPHLGVIEEELVEVARERPIALVLPCHAADLERPPFAAMLRELAGATFLHEIVLSMNGVGEEEFERSYGDRLLAPLSQDVSLIFNDPPPGSDRPLAGKGRNVETAIASLVDDAQCAIIATQDCDVASFRRVDLARLCYAVAHPELGFRFAKMYYSRATDRLYGRVSRLFLTPLLHAVVRVAGHVPLVDFLLSFRYPLAGEVAMTREVAASLRPSSGWEVEIGQLCEVFRHVDPREVCQVEGGADYDHKHQPAAPALAAMVREIARELFAQLAVEGVGAAFRGTLVGAYRQEAAHALRRSAALSLINGLAFDADGEAAIVETFAECLANGS